MVIVIIELCIKSEIYFNKTYILLKQLPWHCV